MVVEDVPTNPCGECGCTSYEVTDGVYICTSCMTENEEIRQFEFEAEFEANQTAAGKSILVNTLKTLSDSRIQTATQNNAKPWLTIEGLQQILQGCTIDVCKKMNLSLEKSDQLLKIVREMWFEYLRGRLICFAGKSNPINSAARDKPMYAAIKNDGFTGIDGTCYIPEVYQKKDKKGDEPIYNAGFSTVCFLVTSSDNEKDEQVALVGEKRKAKIVKKKKRKLYLPLTQTDVLCILHIGLKMVSRPISIVNLLPLINSDPTTYLPSHMNVGRAGYELFQQIIPNAKFFNRFRNKSMFIYLHLVEPRSYVLNGLNSDEIYKNILLHEIKYFCETLKIPSSLGIIIIKISNYLISKLLDKIEDDIKEFMVPNMDLWAISTIYLALVSCRMENSNEYEQWMQNWHLDLTNLLEKKKTTVVKKVPKDTTSKKTESKFKDVGDDN